MAKLFKQLSATQGNEDWWRGASVYQIYLRSYQDTNGDGIGDLAGVVSRIPYIKSLNVDAIWITPFFVSPMKDYGYDVSDYYGVDPVFGSLWDFDKVIEIAHQHGLRVMIDLVLSHTSDQHSWFQESRASRDNPKEDWYVWADLKPDGSPPNNWLSVFGGSAWAWDPKREQYYMHNFLTSQPDLNFHNSKVRKALLDVAQFWLDRGVDGFRLDTVNFYFCDKQLRDNPELPLEKRNDLTAPLVNPYNFQRHIYNKNQPENLEFLRDLRQTMNEYPGTAIVGEVGDSQCGLKIMNEYTCGKDRLHMCYAFEFLSTKPAHGEWIMGVIDRLESEGPRGWPCWAFSNHDVARHISRWNLSDVECRMAINVLVALKGSLCIYQGEELGFEEADIKFEDIQDPYGTTFWPEFKGRDGCRTPMAWEMDQPNAGFSSNKPWLPIDIRHLKKAVDQAECQEGSILHHYRKVLSFRKQYEILRKGEMERKFDRDLLIIRRFLNDESITAFFHFSDCDRTISILGEVLGGICGDITFDGQSLIFRGKGSIFIRQKMS